MTLYRLYSQNGNRAGFWVQHRTWANACGRVQSIGGQRFGGLPGLAPVHDDAAVIVELFDVRSGRRMHLGAPQCPKDRNYTLIAEPWWSHQEGPGESLEAQEPAHSP